MIAIICGWWSSKTSNPWNAETIGDIPVPFGYTRLEAASGSYAEYLRSLPLRKRGTKVNLYTGGEANYQFLSTGVIDQDILSNSEQCADVTMRLRAEYLWQKGRYSEICFRDVNVICAMFTDGVAHILSIMRQHLAQYKKCNLGMFSYIRHALE